MSRRILVTGGSGLVGRNLRELVEAGERAQPGDEWFWISSKDADLTNWESTSALFERVHPTHVIHLAANVGGLLKNLKQGVQMFEDNIAMNNNVLRLCHQHKVVKLVYCLSTCIFPDRQDMVHDESTLHLGEPPKSNYGYGYAKRMLQVLAQMYNGQHGTNFVGISPCNLFGKYDNFSLENGHVVASLIRKITTASKSPEKKMEVLGTGRPLRQFLYAKDFGRMLLWLLNDVNAQELPHGFVVATSGVNEECSIKQLVETIRNVADPEIEIVYRTDMPDGQYKKTCSNAEFRARCPDFAFTSIEDAIRETTQWYQQHSQEARL